MSIIRLIYITIDPADTDKAMQVWKKECAPLMIQQTRLERAERCGIEIAAAILGDGQIVILDLAKARAAQSRRAHVEPGRLRAVVDGQRSELLAAPMSRPRTSAAIHDALNSSFSTKVAQ